MEAGKAWTSSSQVNGILVPGGFGKRGIEGKIAAIRYARENKVPFFGICLGLQCAVIEFARHVCGLKGAHTTEIETRDTPHPVVCLMEEQEKVVDLGATMRLGAWPCVLEEGQPAFAGLRRRTDQRTASPPLRGEQQIPRPCWRKGGLVLSGLSPDRHLVEMIELADHPWFVGVQFHPELKSQPLAPPPAVQGLCRRGRRFYRERASGV
jgi:CTP synthase